MGSYHQTFAVTDTATVTITATSRKQVSNTDTPPFDINLNFTPNNIKLKSGPAIGGEVVTVRINSQGATADFPNEFTLDADEVIDFPGETMAQLEILCNTPAGRLVTVHLWTSKDT